jgi:hypothetical protein
LEVKNVAVVIGNSEEKLINYIMTRKKGRRKRMVGWAYTTPKTAAANFCWGHMLH